jgi:hypothetical protein
MKNTLTATIDKVNNIVNYLQELIEYLETYITHRAGDDADETEQLIICDLEEIHVILSSILHHIKRNEKLRRLVQKEIHIIERLERYVKDMTEHPDNLQRDSEVIDDLEMLLKKVEDEEKRYLD